MVELLHRKQCVGGSSPLTGLSRLLQLTTSQAQCCEFRLASPPAPRPIPAPGASAVSSFQVFVRSMKPCELLERPGRAVPSIADRQGAGYSSHRSYQVRARFSALCQPNRKPFHSRRLYQKIRRRLFQACHRRFRIRCLKQGAKNKAHPFSAGHPPPAVEAALLM